MRRRCLCGKIASTQRVCRSCGSDYSLWHCHDREHYNHDVRRRRALSHEGEDLGPCDGHAHPYDGYDHWNNVMHE